MSCFIMKPEPVASLADYIGCLLSLGYNHYGMDAPRTLRDALKDCKDKYGWYSGEKIYKRLYGLNVHAYEERYGRRPDYFPGLPDYEPNDITERREYADGHETIKPWHYKLEMRLSCLIYQCSEGDCFDSPLYRGLTDLRHALDAHIVCNSSEWYATRWGE